jgi:hypothetical protein
LRHSIPTTINYRPEAALYDRTSLADGGPGDVKIDQQGRSWYCTAYVSNSRDLHAGKEQGEKVTVTVWRQAERGVEVGAGQVVVDMEHDVAPADILLQEVRAEAKALAQQALDLLVGVNDDAPDLAAAVEQVDEA